MRVLVAGATGVIGRALVPVLLEAGHAVTAMARSRDGLAILARAGADIAACDVFDRESLARAVGAAAPDAVVHQMTAIPKRVNPRSVAQDLAPTNRLRTEGTRNLLDAARGARLFVAQSISFAQAPAETPCDETAPLHLAASPSFRVVIETVRDLESLVLAHPGGVALRYGFFHGPGTAYALGGSFHDDVARRRIPLPGAGSGVFSFIHVDDAARATLAALEAGKCGVFNIVDDHPAPLAEWLPVYAREIGAPTPWRVPGLLARLGAGAYGAYLMLEQPGATNAKARRELAWSPTRGWRDGLTSG